MLLRLSDVDRRALRDGYRQYAPTLTAMLSWGLVTGIAMSKSVLTVPQALAMSLLVYAGSSQLAVLPLLAAKLPLWTVLLTAAMVNTRFLIFSAGLTPHFSYHPLWRRMLIGFFNGDIVYLLFMRQGFKPGFEPGKEAFFWGMAATSWLGWQVSSVVGILLASLFPDNWGLDLAGTLALIPIMVSALAGRSTVVAALVASVVAVAGYNLPYRLGLPLAVLAALAGGLGTDRLIERGDLRKIRAGVTDGKVGSAGTAAEHGVPPLTVDAATETSAHAEHGGEA